MADQSDFKRGQIVGAHMAGANVTKTYLMQQGVLSWR